MCFPCPAYFVLLCCGSPVLLPSCFPGAASRAGAFWPLTIPSYSSLFPPPSAASYLSLLFLLVFLLSSSVVSGSYPVRLVRELFLARMHWGVHLCIPLDVSAAIRVRRFPHSLRYGLCQHRRDPVRRRLLIHSFLVGPWPLVSYSW